MQHYYNEFDSKTAAWLRELAAHGHIPHGVIDERSITDLVPADVAGDGQRHFFAGIGGWAEALRLAGWPPGRSVWTGSCPCQPYSTAGKQKGNEDERDLWPAFARLIRECRPDTIFGEQVPGAIGHGWLDRVHADLEREGYAVGHCVLGAHSVQAPHIRQRLYWVANSTSERGRGRQSPRTGRSAESGRSSAVGGLGDASGQRLPERISDGRVQRRAGLAPTRETAELPSHACGLGNSNGSGSFTGGESSTTDGHGRSTEPTGSGPWGSYRVIQCRDGKARRIPVEPEFFPLADGVSARVVRLRGYGNAIVPQVAAVFIKAFLEAS